MSDQNQFLAHNAQNALENHKREQEERKKAMFREQKTRELKQLEAQLFYKKQEVIRLKTLSERLKREAVVKQNNELREKHELQNQERQLKEAESRIHELDVQIDKTLIEIADKILKEKAAIQEHQRKLEELEKIKRTAEGQKETKKRSITESISRVLFFKKKEEREEKIAEDLFRNNQAQLKQIEQSLKTFSQEVAVLENKIRALSSGLK
ncbi:MAG: hypothetical protein RLY49_32 [Candidatus Parcubacteria bacterium]|jgi:hypothetical protein